MNRTEETSRLGGRGTRWLPAGVGILAVVPFAFLEVVNRRGLNEAFPFVLFVLLWALPRRPFLVDDLGLPGLSLRSGTSLGIPHLASHSVGGGRLVLDRNPDRSDALFPGRSQL